MPNKKKNLSLQRVFRKYTVMKHIASSLVTSVVTLFSLFVVLSATFVGCEESTPVELTPSVTPGSGGGENTGGGGSEEKPYLTVSPQSLIFEAEDNSLQTIKVSANTTYDVSTNALWITVTPSGNDWAVSVSVNEEEAMREDSVIVVSATLRQSVKVQQQGKAIEYSLMLDVEALSFDSDECCKTFTITSNDSWTASSDVSWATLSSTSGSGNKTITVSCEANPNATERAGTITIQGNYSGSKTISVSQEGKPSSGGGNGSDNGHEYVDLGLPSGLLWALCNVGADSPEDYGDYFAWGETEPKSAYNWKTYFDTNDGGSSFQKYNNEGGKTVLELEDDAAHVNWGGAWRMPTYSEQEELRVECIWVWTTQNGIKGRKVTGPNGNSIFLPAAGYGRAGNDTPYSAGYWGYYWSSSISTDNSDHANHICFYSGFVVWGPSSNDDRRYGLSVRPVR